MSVLRLSAFSHRVSIQLNTHLLLLIFGGGLYASLVIIAYSSILSLPLILTVGALTFWWGRHHDESFLPAFFFFLPLMGCFNNILRVNGIPVLIPIFLSGIVGGLLSYYFKGERTITVGIPIAVYAFILVSFLSTIVGVISFLPKHPHLTAIVSQAPWGEVRLVNALGWIFLGTLVNMTGAIIYLFLIQDHKSDLRRVFTFLLVGLMGTFFVGLFQFMGWQFIGESKDFTRFPIPQYNATFMDPNSLGTFISLLLPTWLGFMRNKRTPLVFWLGGGGLFFLMMITEARTPFIVFLISFTVLFFASLFKKDWIMMGIFFCLLMGGMVFSHVHPQNSNVRLRTYVQDLVREIRKPRDEGKFWNYIVGDRYTLWRAGWITFRHNPILGTGQGTYLVKMPLYKKEIGHISNDNSCNMFLQIAAEQGIIGLSAFLFLLGSSFWYFLKYQFKKADMLQVGAFSGLVGLSVAFIFSAPLVNFEVNVLFWFLLALITHPIRLS